MSAAVLPTVLTTSYCLSLVGYLFSNVPSNRKKQIAISPNHTVMDIKSGPLDFPSEKSFLLFFAYDKGLTHMFQK